MRLTIDIPDTVVESTVLSIMQNYPEASSSNAMRCEDFDYDGWKYTFRDSEALAPEDMSKEDVRRWRGTIYEVDKAKLLAAFPLIFTDKWPKGCVAPPCSGDAKAWDDWLGSIDNTDHDAFVQLVCLGEVIYG